MSDAIRVARVACADPIYSRVRGANAMDLTSIGLPTVVGVTLGWGLTQVTEYVRGRREDRRVLSRTLSDLLQVRLNLLSIPLIIEELRKRLDIPDQGRPILAMVLSTMTDANALERRYHKAVSAVAAADPLLAFQLRGIGHIPLALHRLRATAIADPSTVGPLSDMETLLTGAAARRLDELILAIARRLGVSTWWRIRRTLRAKAELPPEFDKVLGIIKASVSAGPDATQRVNTSHAPAVQPSRKPVLP